MSNPEATQVFNSVDPLVDSGQSIKIKIEQTLTRAKSGGGNVALLDTTGADSVHLRIEGPQVGLLDSDIVGVFPSPGSDTTPEEFLPHIALARRTLPWEREGPKTGWPWLALLVLKESEIGRRFAVGSAAKPIVSTTVGSVKSTHEAAYASFKAAKLGDQTAVDLVFAPTTTLKQILRIDDLPLLCHVRRAAQDNPLAMIDDDRDLAVVMSGRLPDAGDESDDAQLHFAYLVSLEQRTDLINPVGSTTPLIVLHHWSFTPSGEGDFEAVINAIRVRPNGGVLRFGNLPWKRSGNAPELSGGFAAMLDDSGYLLPPAQHHQQEKPIEYRGPLRPFPPAVRSPGFAIRPAPEEFADAQAGDPPDYSHATAFEIGRLATLAGEGLAEDLQAIRFRMVQPDFDIPVLKDMLPDALRRHDWVVNPQWWANPYTLHDPLSGKQQMLKDEAALLHSGPADFTGIAAQSAPWKNSVINQIAQLAGIGQQVPSGQIDIAVINEQTLNEMFADIVAVTKTR